MLFKKDFLKIKINLKKGPVYIKMRHRIFAKFCFCVLALAVLTSACSVQSAYGYHPNDSYTDKVETKAGTFSGVFRIKTEASDSLTLDPHSSVSSTRSEAMIARYEQIEWQPTMQLNESERGTGGFGSTGK